MPPAYGSSSMLFVFSVLSFFRAAWFPTHSPMFPSSPGEYSYLGTTLRQVAIEPMPSLLDVRQLVTLYGILPLGKDWPLPQAGQQLPFLL